MDGIEEAGPINFAEATLFLGAMFLMYKGGTHLISELVDRKCKERDGVER
jgi:hypothetical protein